MFIVVEAPIIWRFFGTSSSTFIVEVLAFSKEDIHVPELLIRKKEEVCLIDFLEHELAL
jgi:hypothetical protein